MFWCSLLVLESFHLVVQVSDAKGTLQSQMERCITQVTGQIDAVSKARDAMMEQNASVELNLNRAFAELQEALNAAFQKASQEVDTHNKVGRVVTQKKNPTNLSLSIRQMVVHKVHLPTSFVKAEH